MVHREKLRAGPHGSPPLKFVVALVTYDGERRGRVLAHTKGTARVSRLTELLRQARKADTQLGADLEAEIAQLLKRRSFGLVFERHQPEAVELPGRTVRHGDKVRVLPLRGEANQVDQGLWRVERIERIERIS